MIRVLQFADIINRYDFIDNIIQFANPEEFEINVCVRSEQHNIASPVFPERSKYKLLRGNSKKELFSSAWKLSRLLKKWNIDILHTHHFDQAIIGWFATKIYPKTKLVIGRHYSDALYRLPNRLKQRLLLKIEQKINNSASRIIVPSKYIFEILTQTQHVNANKIDIVLYGFDPKKYMEPSAEAIANVRKEFMMEERFVIGNFSRLHEEKGHIYLLNAVSKAKEYIPNLLLLIVGEGSERKKIEKLINESGLSNIVKLLGWRKDAMVIMKAVDIVVQSTLQEAFSQVMCESLWMGRPLVMTDVSGAIDIIKDRENGLLVPRENAQLMADAIIELVQDTELRNKVSQNGRSYVERKLSISSIIPLYEASYRKVLGIAN
ncbi:MAG: glycosyltransferase family 4 protein [Bacteroidia bacterium]|nr:glycosyltransferase family 4 protein [Bacteroidia bacterium]